jgi:hypothetical protein
MMRALIPIFGKAKSGARTVAALTRQAHPRRQI